MLEAYCIWFQGNNDALARDAFTITWPKQLMHSLWIGYNEDIGGEDENQMLKLNRVFSDEKWSKGRVVTSIDWSYKYPELVLGSYNSNPSAVHAPEGVCLVRNTKYKKESPEYIFQCESPLMTARF